MMAIAIVVFNMPKQNERVSECTDAGATFAVVIFAVVPVAAAALIVVAVLVIVVVVVVGLPC